MATNKSAKIIVIVCFALLVAINAGLFWAVKDRVLAGFGDFGHFYAAALIVRNGSGEKLYDYEEQRQAQKDLFPEVDTRPEPLIFNHLAYETLAWLPLTFYPYATAAVLWTLINLFLLLVASVLLRRQFPEIWAAVRFPLILPFLACYPVFIALIQGQDSVLLLVLYVLTYLFLQDDRHFLAGCVLSFGLFKFQLVLPFTGFFFLQRDWKFVSGFAACSGIPIGISLWIVGKQGSLELLRFLVRSNKGRADFAQFGLYPENMPNIRGILFSLLSGATTIELLFAITVLFSVVLFGWAVRTSLSLPVDLRYAVAILVTLLVSYHLFVYDLTIATLPVLIVVERMASVSIRGRRLYELVLVVSCALLFLTPVHLAMISYGISASCLVIPVFVLAALCWRIFLPEHKNVANLAAA